MLKQGRKREAKGLAVLYFIIGLIILLIILAVIYFALAKLDYSDKLDPETTIRPYVEETQPVISPVEPEEDDVASDFDSGIPTDEVDLTESEEDLMEDAPTEAPTEEPTEEPTAEPTATPEPEGPYTVKPAGEATVYFYESGSKGFHKSPTRHEMDGAPAHTLAEAQASGKHTCGICKPAALELIGLPTLWLDEDGTCHTSDECAAFQGKVALIARDDALAQGLAACPDCGAGEYLVPGTVIAN